LQKERQVFRWDAESLTLPALPKKVLESSLLTGGDVVVTQGSQDLSIRVAKTDQREIDTIVKLELDGPADDIPAVGVPVIAKVRATASSIYRK